MSTLSTAYPRLSGKINLNSCSEREFQPLDGLYPLVARKIINNAPYEQVEDVLNIPELTERQKLKLQAQLDRFTVKPNLE